MALIQTCFSLLKQIEVDLTDEQPEEKDIVEAEEILKQTLTKMKKASEEISHIRQRSPSPPPAPPR